MQYGLALEEESMNQQTQILVSIKRSSFQIKGNHSTVLREQPTECCIQFSLSYFKKSVDKLESISKERQPEWLLPQQQVRDHAGFIYIHLSLSGLLCCLSSGSRMGGHHWITSSGHLGRTSWVLSLHSRLHLVTQSCWVSSPNSSVSHTFCLTTTFLEVLSIVPRIQTITELISQS